jgi:hypothetical protein
VIEVRSLAPGDESAYDAFVRRHPAGLFYYGIAYRDLVASHLYCQHDYQIALEDGNIHGALPVMWRDDDGGRIYNSLPFYGSHGGPLAATVEIERALWARWHELTTAAGTLSATVVTNPLQPPAQPPAHTFVDERISQMTSLPRPPLGDRSTVEDAVLASIDGSARRNVRKALRLGVTVERGRTEIPRRLQQLATLHGENMRALGGTAKPPDFFAAIERHFTPPEDFDVYVAHCDGRVAAALLLFTVGDTVEYFTPAVDANYRSYQPLAAILYSAMTDAVERRAQRWNWGGTWVTQTTLFRFKRKWGAVESRYRYFVTLNDESLLRARSVDLQERFPGFYVVPFRALGP